MKYLYTATFEEENGKVFARVPDLAGCVTTGKNLSDAIEQIADAASGWLVVAEDEGDEVPSATPQTEIERDENTICSVIQIDTLAYRAATDTRAVRKNVSLPAWMAALADKRGVNCSQLLQDSLMKMFNVA